MKKKGISEIIPPICKKKIRIGRIQQEFSLRRTVKVSNISFGNLKICDAMNNLQFFDASRINIISTQ